MKTILSTIVIFLGLAFSLEAQYDLKNDFIEFDKKLIDLGQVKKGDKVDAQFTFTNISNEDVIVELVSTCDCTDADWPYDPIPPGEEGTISFTFDSAKKDKIELLSLDVILQNVDAKSGEQVFDILEFKYEFVFP